MKYIFEKLGKMGLFITFLVVTVITYASAQMIYDLYNGLTYTTVVTPHTVGAPDTTIIDVSPYIGKVVFIQTVSGVRGGAITFTSKVQGSSDGTNFGSPPTDSAFTDVTSAATTGTGSLQMKAYDTRKIKRYLRYITTISASDTVCLGVMMISQSRNK